MNDHAVAKIKSSILDRKTLYREFDENVATFKHLRPLCEEAMKEGSLSTKTKELMALSIAIVTKCEPCIEWHLEQAIIAEASDENIYETIDVAIEMGGGPSAAYARFVLNGLKYFKEKHQVE